MRAIEYDEPGTIEYGDGSTSGASLRVATGFRERFLGLMGQRQVPAGSLMTFPRCSSIHMFWMRVPIDVLWLARPEEGGRARVLAVTHWLAPGRLDFGPSRTWGCCEARAGSFDERVPTWVESASLARWAGR